MTLRHKEVAVEGCYYSMVSVSVNERDEFVQDKYNKAIILTPTGWYVSDNNNDFKGEFKHTDVGPFATLEAATAAYYLLRTEE